ncbi:hypothetical protein HY480_03270 [Candidatus Uhrbacteria bacterium]|nr:hypothetical protein [Candidatus Uhrbacteria bacterium]
MLLPQGEGEWRGNDRGLRDAAVQPPPLALTPEAAPTVVGGRDLESMTARMFEAITGETPDTRSMVSTEVCADRVDLVASQRQFT